LATLFNADFVINESVTVERWCHINDRKTEVLERKTDPSLLFQIKILHTLAGLGINPGLLSKSPAGNRLSHGTTTKLI